MSRRYTHRQRDTQSLVTTIYISETDGRLDNAGHDGSVDQTFYDLDSSLLYLCHPGYVRRHHKEPRPSCLGYSLPSLISHFVQN